MSESETAPPTSILHLLAQAAPSSSSTSFTNHEADISSPLEIACNFQAPYLYSIIPNTLTASCITVNSECEAHPAYGAFADRRVTIFRILRIMMSENNLSFETLLKEPSVEVISAYMFNGFSWM